MDTDWIYQQNRYVLCFLVRKYGHAVFSSTAAAFLFFKLINYKKQAQKQKEKKPNGAFIKLSLYVKYNCRKTSCLSDREERVVLMAGIA